MSVLKHRATRRAVPLCLLGAVATAAVGLPSANAAFPGANGKITFRSDRDSGEPQQVYTMRADGTNERQITYLEAGSDGLPRPAFSPSGKKIAFHSPRGEGGESSTEIYTVNPDGTSQRRLTDNNVPDSSPAYSRDGRKIAFERCRDGCGIWTMTSDGKTQRLRSDADGEYKPVFSPTEDRIAYQRRQGDDAEIYVMDSDGGDEDRLTDNDRFDGRPDYSPDGKRIVFMSGDDGQEEIYVMDSDGDNRTQLTDNNHLDADPVFSPDGKRIAFTSQDERGDDLDVYVMNADGSGRTRLTDDRLDDAAPDWQPLP